ncbi:hypothetical protein BDP27DRAFT_1417956 [Rhodocollybia butyracea]|uniref:Uncharacterized protein n=1 Tax=Rhodocollybia butyracea TaxID=206335 RepID=A0A9P5Q2X2_9AGAR|nr:hypothetical protein BDP27DRAFT_1417956 [Rhodocollybia butyracea]
MTLMALANAEDVISLYRTHALSLRASAKERAAQIEQARADHLAIHENEKARLQRISQKSADATTRNNDRLKRLAVLYSKGTTISKTEILQATNPAPSALASTSASVTAPSALASTSTSEPTPVSAATSDSTSSVVEVSSTSNKKHDTTETIDAPANKRLRHAPAATPTKVGEMQQTNRRSTRAKTSVDMKGKGKDKQKNTDNMNVD